MNKQRIRVQNANSVLAVSKSLLTTEYYGFEHGYGKSKDYKIGIGVKGQILNVMGRDYVSQLSNTSICVLLYRKVSTLKIQLNIYLSPVQSRILWSSNKRSGKPVEHNLFNIMIYLQQFTLVVKQPSFTHLIILTRSQVYCKH